MMEKEYAGNAAALRAALEKAELGLFRWLSGAMNRDEHHELVATIKEALAAPARNCDVGTAAEQSQRFCAFCRPRLEPCDGCSCLEGARHGRCEFIWAQMPYENEEAR